ncbi:MAG: hypothetical protein ACRDAM_01600 [Casimicrobium sp.]
METKQYGAAAFAFAALVAFVYVAKPSYQEVAVQNAALSAQWANETQVVSDTLLPDSCFDDSLRATNCNDLLIAEAATGHAYP